MQRSTQPLSNNPQPRMMVLESGLENDSDVNRHDLADLFEKMSQDLTGGRATQESQAISDLSTLHISPKKSQSTSAFGPYTARNPGLKPAYTSQPYTQHFIGDSPPQVLGQRPAPPPPIQYNTTPMDMDMGPPPPDFGRPLQPSLLPLDWAPKWPNVLENHCKGQSIKNPTSDKNQHVAGKVDSESSEDTSSCPSKPRSQIAPTPNKDVESEQTPANTSGPDVPDLARVLSRTATEYLGLNLLGDDPQSRFFAHLLNDIERLQAQVKVLNFRLHQPSQPPSLEQVTNTGKSAEDLKPRMQVLHRVYEESPTGSMVTTYADEPQLSAAPGYNKWVLQGKERIFDLEFYLKSNPDICFVVFMEYGPEKRRNQNNEHQEYWHSSRKERMRIVGETFRQAVHSIGTCVLNETLAHEIEAPYLYFYHHRDKLSKLKYDENKGVREPSQLLWTYLDERYAAEYREADELISRGFITQRHLAKLYKPNEIVINFKGNKPEALMISMWPKESNEDTVTFQAWQWNFDGTVFRRVNSRPKETIPATTTQAQNEMRINDLKHIPCKFVPESMVRNLLARGRKYWDMRKRTFASYSGWDAWHEDRYDNARIMIDTETYHRMAHSSAVATPPPPPPPNMAYIHSQKAMVDTLPETIDVDGQMPKQGFMLLPSTVKGFDIQNKRWIKVFTDQVGSLDWNKRAFERLVLDKKSKEMIKALISVHVQTQHNKMHDIIRNKGNGLIILLHGSPGTGKTLTAESVAELAEKPLYSISCGDIGTDAAVVEKHLRTVLYLGKIWDCVLLLDEADVFLEERAMADLHRNSLVSVFLRTLEYYDGILILTSNRVGTFDEAFKSRIQVALYYKPLTKNSRKQIWQNFFEILEESGGDVNMSELEDKLEELAAEEMNGRQIRNSLLTARQLAMYRKETLDWEHLQQVIKTGTDFSRYLKKVHGHTDEQWAREDGRR